MELNKKNVMFLFSIVFLTILFVVFWNKNKDRAFYKSELSGITEEIKSNPRFENSKVIKFEGANDFNYLFWFYAPDFEDLKVGDSIYKSKDSYEYQIYRKDAFAKYQFYKILKNQP
ncbi:hypothetical protein [Epilithonimonas zeae]|uniref:hypothetical protein n=1 Tax=Epilithonimonas zeae TaxID=1416779 RepID=UPI00200FCF73|nr:hypothetical protein [Epilithonimonas zeae]UQB67785.1 hypothetical protein KI430_12170 [Epilithonimonas zeae]